MRVKGGEKKRNVEVPDLRVQSDDQRVRNLLQLIRRMLPFLPCNRISIDKVLTDLLAIRGKTLPEIQINFEP